MRPVVWITRQLVQPAMDAVAADFDVITNPTDAVMDGDALVAASHQCDAMLICHSELITAEVAARLSPRLKIIANYSVGVDHVDLAACQARGIVVTNTPDVLSDATAEIGLLLLLGAARRAYEGDRMVRQGLWTTWGPTLMNGIQVTGKRLGIVGMGRVGQVLAKRARGFDMEIHYHNRKSLDETLVPGAIYHSTLESLMRSVDMLSLNCPATPDTERMINAQSLAWLRPGAIIVNAARGKLVDEDALIAALQSGHIAGAGLECFVNEPGGNPKFAALDNVFLLPHLGSSTNETRLAMGQRALLNLNAYFCGELPPDRLV